MDQLSNPEEGRTLFIHDLLRSMKHHLYEKDKEGQSEGDFIDQEPILVQNDHLLASSKEKAKVEMKQ